VRLAVCPQLWQLQRLRDTSMLWRSEQQLRRSASSRFHELALQQHTTTTKAAEHVQSPLALVRSCSISR
jgi:hypothetical protein